MSETTDDSMIEGLLSDLGKVSSDLADAGTEINQLNSRLHEICVTVGETLPLHVQARGPIDALRWFSAEIARLTTELTRITASYRNEEREHTESLDEIAALRSRNGRLEECLRSYVVSQGRMCDRWSESDDLARAQLWADLHHCEQPARAALAGNAAPEKQEGK